MHCGRTPEDGTMLVVQSPNSGNFVLQPTKWAVPSGTASDAAGPNPTCLHAGNV